MEHILSIVWAPYKKTFQGKSLFSHLKSSDIDSSSAPSYRRILDFPPSPSLQPPRVTQGCSISSTSRSLDWQFLPSVDDLLDPIREIRTPRASSLWGHNFQGLPSSDTGQSYSNPFPRADSVTNRVHENVEWINFIEFWGGWRYGENKGIAFQF